MRATPKPCSQGYRCLLAGSCHCPEMLITARVRIHDRPRTARRTPFLPNDRGCEPRDLDNSYGVGTRRAPALPILAGVPIHGPHPATTPTSPGTAHGPPVCPPI